MIRMEISMYQFTEDKFENMIHKIRKLLIDAFLQTNRDQFSIKEVMWIVNGLGAKQTEKGMNLYVKSEPLKKEVRDDNDGRAAEGDDKE
jgi:hypothetical protein